MPRPRTALAQLAAVAAVTVLAVAGLIPMPLLEGLLVLSAGWVVFRVLKAHSLAVAVGSGLATALLLALAQWLYPELRYAPYLLVVPTNLLIAAVFARSLLPGRQPVILALVEIMDLAPVRDAAFRRFAALQCALWSGLALATAGLAAVAMIDPVLRPEARTGLELLILGQLLWFALSHHYASLRYGRPETWWMTLRVMVRPDVWQRLTA